MKPKYILLLLVAVFITLLADGLSAGLVGISTAVAAIPIVDVFVAAITAPIGLGLALTVGWCINITMGAGLWLFLVLNGMYHPKWGPASFVGAAIPGLNALPFLVGMVVAGIMHDMAKQEGGLGTAAKLGENLGNVYKTGAGSLAKAGSAAGAVMNARQPHMAAAGAQKNNEQPQERTSSTLQTKNFDGIKPYVPKAA
jgi:hypothetical protein